MLSLKVHIDIYPSINLQFPQSQCPLKTFQMSISYRQTNTASFVPSQSSWIAPSMLIYVMIPEGLVSLPG